MFFVQSKPYFSTKLQDNVSEINESIRLNFVAGGAKTFLRITRKSK